MRPASVSPASVRSLYRTYLRQSNALPHVYLRLFFRVIARDAVEKILSFHAPTLRARNFETVLKSIKKLIRANAGDEHAFQHILDLAYGRKGKLKWELLEPMLHPKGLSTLPKIPAEKPSYPVISEEIKALLISPYSRRTKPLDPNDIEPPRTLPERANVLSKDAMLFGPLSKRREANIRRRFFDIETKKLLPPLRSSTVRSSSFPPRSHLDAISALHDNLQATIGPLGRSPTRTRRERLSAPEEYKAENQEERHSSRWIRRRFRALISRVPELSYGAKGTPVVQPSPLSFLTKSTSPKQMPEADPSTLAWLQLPTLNTNKIKTRTQQKSTDS
ncbi:hypothetical protein CPB83DRAFT_907377 [Crepidotus variabilis]|uniref:LYR motif-containing protein Cup1-like N-terminal domain-containing protein n=1 Tax=Crepidotus variabilis TaxID=179855 RepID=A0A9P6JNU8_9AGAR|nr:hypothetical protein CPB83DRAFT_907377 [Crepidotus variabilis]